jgi:hypothetical protein
MGMGQVNTRAVLNEERRHRASNRRTKSTQLSSTHSVKKTIANHHLTGTNLQSYCQPAHFLQTHSAQTMDYTEFLSSAARNRREGPIRALFPLQMIPGRTEFGAFVVRLCDASCGTTRLITCRYDQSRIWESESLDVSLRVVVIHSERSDCALDRRSSPNLHRFDREDRDHRI